MNIDIKQRGAFYTPDDLADFMCKIAIKRDTSHVLEPSYGDGLFIKHLQKHKKNFHIDAVEIDFETFQESKKNLKNVNLINENFLSLRKKKEYDLIIGNPPFVRTRNLPKEQKEIAQKIYKEDLGLRSHSDPSSWLLFIYKSFSFLKHGGTLCFVLPFDMTFVSYAVPLWNHIFNNFGKIDVYHSKRRYFPEILQDTIVLKLSKYGDQSSSLNYYIYEDSFKGNSRNKNISKEPILKKQKPFKYALLTEDFFEIERKIENKLYRLGDCIDFHIGYVSGNKNYFHPQEEIINRFELSKENFIETLAEPKSIKRTGIYTSNIEPEKMSKLFYPLNQTNEANKYIQFGEDNKFHTRKKTSSRNPWYLTPLVEVPDFILSTFKDSPILLDNDARYIATNSFLCGYIKKNDLLSQSITKKSLISGWYSSLTKLFFELEIHSLGGGRMVIIPGEICNVRVPIISNFNNGFLDKLNKKLFNDNLLEAVELTDRVILNKLLRLNTKEIDIIKDNLSILNYWRNPG